MINVSELIDDPDFAQAYTGVRITGQWVDGDFVKTETSISFYGPVIAASIHDINMVPEGDRVAGMMTFLTKADNPFYVSQASDSYEGISDYLIWRGDRYKLVQVMPLHDYGFVKGIGARIGGA